MLANTLAIKKWTINHWLKQKETPVVTNATALDTKNEIIPRESNRIDYLKEFFVSLAKMDSHYCSSSSKQYLEPLWKTKGELYCLYKSDWCSIKYKERPLSNATFLNTFEDLNLSIFTPRM